MIIPALDLLAGQVVRLYQGDYYHQQHYTLDPLIYLQQYQQQGATLIHLVDLSGAKQPDQRQTSLLNTLLAHCQCEIQIGGGIRHPQEIEALLQAGAKRVVIGSSAVHQPARVSDWFKHFDPAALVLALDINMDSANIPLVATHGWQQRTQIPLTEVIEHYLPYGLQHVLCTDIARDGTLQGTNIDLYRTLTTAYPGISWQASGGIGCLEDLSTLRPSHVASVIVGKALLEQKFTLSEAIACWQNASSPALM